MGVATFLVDRLVHFLKFNPTDCQRRVFERLADFVSGVSGNDILLINGYAGTGKTASIAAFVALLKETERRFVLMAPTGRAAKVLSNYTKENAYTIHKQIYRQKSMDGSGGSFSLDFNKCNDTFFIVDEASLISSYSSGSNFGSGDLLEDVICYVREGRGNRLILIGDDAQLPPIALERSPALDMSYLQNYGYVESVSMTSVVRQSLDSGILYNATILRKLIKEVEECGYFQGGLSDVLASFNLNFEDVFSINGGDLIESISDSFDKFGMDETVVLCRSNKRANRYNGGIRSSILYREERLSRGDKLMVVKNCYNFLKDVKEMDFIANGDVAELMRIHNYEKRYGLTFADAVLSFPDYKDIEIDAKIVLDTLESETPSLSKEQQNALYEGVYLDYEHISTKKKRNEAVREDPFYNALQIKYASAITCHKSQGGQWDSVFVDNPFWKDEVTLDDLKWLYTAMTRGVKRVYFVNFKF